MRENERLVSPPGVIATLTAGFDLTARHLWLLLVPILLDLFLWLGPRLSFRVLMERLVRFWQDQAVTAGFNTDLLLELAPRTNLFTSLSVPVIGVPAFIVGATPERTPLPTTIHELNDFWTWAGLFILFSLIGLLLSASYLSLVADVVRKDAHGFPGVAGVSQFLKRLVRTWLQIIGLLAVFLGAAFILYIPLVVVSTLLAFASTGLAALVLFIGPVFAIWLVFYLTFVPHGLMLYGRPLRKAIVESVRIIQGNLLSAMALLVGIILINQALDWLLLLAEDGSWFSAVSIVGHAYVSTALVVATFIFYRYRYEIMAGAR
jgi:hypothetical protein